MNQVEISTKNITFSCDKTDNVLTQHFYIRNFSKDQKVCFKIKSTSNKKFIVSPFTGVIAKEDEAKISVMLKRQGIDS